MKVSSRLAVLLLSLVVTAVSAAAKPYDDHRAFKAEKATKKKVSVPEPATLLLVAAGLGAATITRRFKRNSQ